MPSSKRWKPSPALIVAILALCVALAGTAIAGPLAEISSLDKKEKKQTRKIARNIAKKIAKGQINLLAPGLAVASANTANSAKTADNATSVGGARVVQIHAFVPDNGATTTILNQGGFQIKMTCSVASQVTALTADTTAADAFLLSHSTNAVAKLVQNGVSNDEFDAADNTNLSPEVNPVDELEFVTYFDAGTGGAGPQVRARYVVGQDDGSTDGAIGCYAVGTAEIL